MPVRLRTRLLRIELLFLTNLLAVVDDDDDELSLLICTKDLCFHHSIESTSVVSSKTSCSSGSKDSLSIALSSGSSAACDSSGFSSACSVGFDSSLIHSIKKNVP